MKKAAVYIHGKGGSSDETHHYEKFFKDGHDLIGFDYKSEFPWEAKPEFQNFFTDLSSRYDGILLIANSIGAYFSLISLNGFFEKAMLISPIVDMEKLILDMLKKANVTEKELSLKKFIKTSFGELLSWEYLSYARGNPVTWNTPSSILYGENDNLTSLETIRNFADRINADLTIMENGEHWFHTDEQMLFLDNWFEKHLKISARESNGLK